MQEFHIISIRQADDRDKKFCFQVKKSALKDYITPIWGWDEDYQIKFHEDDWKNKKPDIICLEGHDIGTIEITEKKDHLLLGEFYLFPEFQNKGIGSKLLQQFVDLSVQKNITAKLQVIKINPAQRLYLRFGFVVYDQTETHYLMERPPTS